MQFFIAIFVITVLEEDVLRKIIDLSNSALYGCFRKFASFGRKVKQVETDRYKDTKSQRDKHCQIIVDIHTLLGSEEVREKSS